MFDLINSLILDKLIKNALIEDIGTGDITTQSTVPADQRVTGNFIAKEEGIVCGTFIAKRVFELIDSEITFNPLVKEGNLVKKGDIIAVVDGPARGILSGERVALNFMQRMSGIATRTNELAEQIKGTNAVIADTRKTTPGLRVIEKYAVKAGGGSNHRFNLSDGVLIKDNHIVAAGGIEKAIVAARRNIPHTLKIEVEVENFDQIEEALRAGADIIMLDNMDIPAMKEAVKRIGHKALVEASGNMGDKNLREVAETGVDIISIGALTHTVRAFDISLRFK